MKTLSVIALVILSFAGLSFSQSPRRAATLGENAALRYWSAFSQMQDSSVSEQQAQELNRILAGTAPYSDLEYKDLVEKNRAALDTMARGSALPNCDWGIDYELGPNAPVDYVRKALELGRLNVLNAFHLSITRNTEGAVRAVATGLRFSHDVANGGTVFAAVVAKNLLVEHLRAMVFLLHVAGLSAQQRQSLRKAVAELGPEGLDWRSAVQRELAVLSVPTPRPEGVGKLDAEASAALDRISSEYVEALNNPSRLPHLKELIASAPKPLADVIPNPTRVVQEKQDLARQIKQVGSLLK